MPVIYGFAKGSIRPLGITLHHRPVLPFMFFIDSGYFLDTDYCYIIRHVICPYWIGQIKWKIALNAIHQRY